MSYLEAVNKCGKIGVNHREKRLKWAENNMKDKFENVIFTGECRATLDGPRPYFATSKSV